jgi:hypothetical protein
MHAKLHSVRLINHGVAQDSAKNPFRPGVDVMDAGRKTQSFSSAILYTIGIAIFAGGLGTLGYQGVHLLKYGTWVRFEMADLWTWIGGTPVDLRWGTTSRATIWVLESPLGMGLVVLGAIGMWVSQVSDQLRQ